MTEREPEGPAGPLKPTCFEVMLPQVSIIMGPILREGGCGGRAGMAGGGVFLQKALPTQERSFRRDVPGDVTCV